MTQKYCPKCKNPINDNDLRCNRCNMRLKQICPECGSVNTFGVEKCSACGNTLIKYCENCGSANLPNADVCRKCSSPLSVSEEPVLTFNKKREKTNKSSNNLEVSIPEKQETVQKPITEEKIQGNYVPQEVVDEKIIPPEYDENQQYEDVEPQPEIIDEEPQEIVDNEEPDFIDENEPELVDENEPEFEEYEQEEQEEFVQDTNEPIQNNYTETPDYQDNLPELDIDENIDTSQVYNDDSAQIVCFDDSEQLISQLQNIIQMQNNAVVTGICAEEGMGKSTLLKTFTNYLSEQGFVPIFAENSELIKVSPFGSIRDMLLRLLTLPDIHPDISSFFSQETRNLFVQNFETLTIPEIIDFMNFLYPTKEGTFENLQKNKEQTVALLEKIFQSILSKNNAVFVIDNFDLTDNASFEVIQSFILKGIINNRTKLFITYREKRSAKVYFDKEIASQDIFATLYLNTLNEDNQIALIKNLTNAEFIPPAVQFPVKDKGNIFFIEQFLTMLFDTGYMFISSNKMNFKDDEPIPFIPKNTEEIISFRFNGLDDEVLKNALITASVMGYKFDKSAFAQALNLTAEQSNEILNKLSDLLFIQQASDYEYAFRNMTVWSVIFGEAHKHPEFSSLCAKIFEILNSFAMSNPILRSTVAKYKGDSNIALQSWHDTANISAYLGDSNIYALAVEQMLLQTGYNESLTEFTAIQLQIMEYIAKIIYKSNPQKAIKYLTPVITNYVQNDNKVKTIDLCGYLIKACYLTSDYNGAIETVDVILKSAEADLKPLDKALITSKKIYALFRTGNCEEGINLINNDIIPKLEEALAKENDEKFSQQLFNVWFDSSVNLIKLYALQGNSKAVEVADNIKEIMEMNEINNPLYTVKLNLAKAFAYTICGYITKSQKLLTETEKIGEYNNKTFISQRNLIYVLNLMFLNQTENIQELLFEYAKFAENANDNNGKHFYKVMLTLLTAKENPEQANVILNDELTYFAQEKTVTGALLCWFFIAQNTLTSNDTERAEHVALKALEVAQNPKFSQYHIAVYLQKLIAEINLIKADATACKMYLEKGMLTAKQFGMDLAQIHLYRAYAGFLGNMISAPNANIQDCYEKTVKIYQAATVLAEKLELNDLKNEILQEQNEFSQYCENNGITINT